MQHVANTAKPKYARHLLITALLAFGAHALLRSAGYTIAQSADGTALVMLALLALLTGLTAVSKPGDEPSHASASRLLAMAAAASASSIGASTASGHVALFIVGFFVGIPYVVHALRKEIDDHLSLTFLLFASVVQVSFIFWLVS